MGTFFIINTNGKSIPFEFKIIAENIGNKNFLLEIASSEADRELGLGKRVSLAADHGMIFVFDKSDMYGFWMKDTNFPLDILWLNESCVVVGKATMLSESFPKVFYPDFPAKYAIELPLNSASNIREGNVLSCSDIKNIKIK